MFSVCAEHMIVLGPGVVSDKFFLNLFILHLAVSDKSFFSLFFFNFTHYTFYTCLFTHYTFYTFTHGVFFTFGHLGNDDQSNHCSLSVMKT